MLPKVVNRQNLGAKIIEVGDSEVHVLSWRFETKVSMLGRSKAVSVARDKLLHAELLLVSTLTELIRLSGLPERDE